MCEIIIKAKNHVNPDPEEDRTGAYKKGMPITVAEDGYPWARLENKHQWITEGNDQADWHNKTIIVKLPGVPVATVEDFIDEQTEDDNGVPVFEDDGTTPKRYRRRRWHLLVDNLPAATRATLVAEGEITTTKAKVRNYLKRIRDNAQYTGLD